MILDRTSERRCRECFGAPSTRDVGFPWKAAINEDIIHCHPTFDRILTDVEEKESILA